MSTLFMLKRATNGWSRKVAAAAGASVLYGVFSRQPALRNDSHTSPSGQSSGSQERTAQAHRAYGDTLLSKTPEPATNPRAMNRLASGPQHDVPLVDNKDDAAWATFSNHFATARDSIASIEWSSLGDRIVDVMLPDWAQALPHYIQKLQLELKATEGSLADEIWQEACDSDMNPEIAYHASVRYGQELSDQEKRFVLRRKSRTTKALATYLDVAEDDVNPQDVPTIAMCGSGGGLRALVAGASSYLCAQEAGLFDCVTYTAGVSGSCWLQTLYYSSLGNQRHDRILDHLKSRISTHIAYPPTALELFTTAPTNKFLLSGCVEKLKADPTADFGLVDVYGLLLAARLLIPRGDLGVNPLDLKISNQRTYLLDGEHPMPIYTAVRHEIPVATPKKELDRSDAPESLKEKAKEEAWFQWFEFTPYEFWCEELDAGIPSFAVGRKFDKGSSVVDQRGLGQPEVKIPFLMGIWGSAFCATLSHYYKG